PALSTESDSANGTGSRLIRVTCRDGSPRAREPTRGRGTALGSDALRPGDGPPAGNAQEVLELIERGDRLVAGGGSLPRCAADRPAERFRFRDLPATGQLLQRARGCDIQGVRRLDHR